MLGGHVAGVAGQPALLRLQVVHTRVKLIQTPAEPLGYVLSVSPAPILTCRGGCGRPRGSTASWRSDSFPVTHPGEVKPLGVAELVVHEVEVSFGVILVTEEVLVLGH